MMNKCDGYKSNKNIVAHLFIINSPMIKELVRLKLRPSQDVYISLVIFAFLAFIYSQTIHLPKNSALFPKMLLGAFLILNIFLLIKGIKSTIISSKTGQSIIYSLSFSGLKKPIFVFLIIIGYILIFKSLGYFVATTIMLPTMMVYFKIHSWKKIVSIVFIYNLFIYILFVWQLNVPLL